MAWARAQRSRPQTACATASPCAASAARRSLPIKRRRARCSCRRLRKCGTIRRNTLSPRARNTPSTTPSGERRSRRRTAINSLSSTRRPCRSKRRSWTRSRRCRTRASPTRCTIPSAAFRPLRRCASASSTTAGASAGATSARSRSTRGGWSHPAATNPSSARWSR